MIKINQIKEETAKYIKMHFSYNPETGEITRDDRRNSTGSICKEGYIRLKVKGEVILAHRIAWYLYYGTFPKGELDHINRCKTDNRICNLREATRSMQCFNRDIKPNPQTGVRGVCAMLYRNGKRQKKPFYTGCLGKTRWFYTIEEAKQFRLSHGLPI